MWLTTLHGFISAVEDRSDPDLLLVRARVKEDIENTFPGVSVASVPGSDYQFRAQVPRADVADRLARYVMDELTYQSHFKDVALANSEPNAARYGAYYDCWAAMAEMQPCAPYSTTPRPPRARWEDDLDD